MKLPVEIRAQWIKSGDTGELGNNDKTPTDKEYVLLLDIFVQNARSLVNQFENGIESLLA